MKGKEDFARYASFTICFICLLLAGCTADAGLELGQTTPTTTIPQVTEPPPTGAMAVTDTLSATPTTLQTSTATPRLSPTPRPTHTPLPPTVTPLPTIPPADVPEFVWNLFETNGGCQLPCWWGIVPGQTTWADAWNFLSTFAEESTVGGAGQQRAVHDIVIPKPDGARLDGQPSEFWQAYIVSSNSGNVLMIQVGFGAERYPLPEVLATFGEPDEVWIGTTGIYVPHHPFYVIVSYPSRGIMVQYVDTASLENDLLIGCPQYIGEEPFMPELWLSSPEGENTFSEIATTLRFAGEVVQQFRPLEEATGMDVKTFYEIFRDPDNTECLATPLDLWPDYWP
jgi:hypothetical protein